MFGLDILKKKVTAKGNVHLYMILLESDHEFKVLASANSRTVAVSQSYTETDII